MEAETVHLGAPEGAVLTTGEDLCEHGDLPHALCWPNRMISSSQAFSTWDHKEISNTSSGLTCTLSPVSQEQTL